MSDVIFNPDQSSGGYNFGHGNRNLYVTSVGFITKVVMKLTGIKDERAASQALVALAICCFVASAVILWSSF